MSDPISADWTTLLQQASMTAIDHHSVVSNYLEEKYGSKFVKENPEIALRLAEQAHYDFRTTALSVLGDRFVEGMNRLAEALESRDDG